MKKIPILLVVLLISSPAFAGSHKVKGYVKKDGTYVPSHIKTGPDKTKQNNWSTQGNTNPYTGKKGTKTATKKK